MIIPNLRKSLNTYFTSTGINNYHIDHAPPFDIAPNKEGFIVWDTEDHSFFECSEGLGYSGTTTTTNTDNYIACSLSLEVTCYSNMFAQRANMSKIVMDLFYPIIDGVRTPLRGVSITDGFIISITHISTTEFPVQKTGQSTPELSACILTFELVLAIKET